MKQIDIIKTYAQKHCLVVDDMPDTRTSVKRILIDYGVVNIETAGHAEEAIELCQKQQFDIVISDYNLGIGKNGQQLLEELRYQGLLRNVAIFVLITAETNIHQVLHTLEFMPDDYMSKPVNKASLRPRLDQALLRNIALLPIKEALDQRNPLKAIAACQDVINRHDKYHNDARKMMGALCISEKMYDEANAIFHGTSPNHRPIWASLGIARVMYEQHQFDLAEDALLKITEEHPYCIEAMDLLAKLYERTYKLQQAQKILSEAIKISPNSASRQRELGRVSLDLGDNSLAILSYKRAIKNSRNSYHESAGDYINLAQGLGKLTRKTPDENNQKLCIEALEILKTVDKKYGKHPITSMHSKLIEADIYSLSHNKNKSQQCIDIALEIHQKLRYSVIENTATQQCIDCAKAFIDVGEYDAGEHILQELSSLNKNNEFALKIDTLLREPKTPEGIAYAGTLNKKGISFYTAKDYEGAIHAFIHVLRAMPNHIGLNLNLIQALISKHKIQELNTEEVWILENSFKRVGSIDSHSHHAERYAYLHVRYQKLLEAYTHENI